MARGRILGTSISVSHQVAELPSTIARLIFTWLVCHADAMGRFSAHPKVVAGKVLTLLDVDEGTIGRSLVAMHTAGLIRLYEADGQPYLVFLGWERHQIIRHDREKAKYPEPTGVFPRLYAEYLPADEREVSGTAPVMLPADTGVSPIEEQKIGSSSTSDGTRRPALDHDAFVTIYNQHRGALPEVLKLSDKRRSGIAKLVEDHTIEEALGLFEDATKFAAADPFWVERGYNLDNLLSQPGRVLEKAEKYRAAAARPGTPSQYQELGL
jgi:hypothetical protein